jgi:hypothetical protein
MRPDTVRVCGRQLLGPRRPPLLLLLPPFMHWLGDGSPGQQLCRIWVLRAHTLLQRRHTMDGWMDDCVQCAYAVHTPSPNATTYSRLGR